MLQGGEDSNNTTGRGRTNWKFFDKINKILGSQPGTHPPVVLDTADNSHVNEEGHDEHSDDNVDILEDENSQENVEATCPGRYDSQ